MKHKLEENANYFPTKRMRIAYIKSCVKNDAYKHIYAQSRLKFRIPFTTAEWILTVLFKVYSDTNWKHTAMN